MTNCPYCNNPARLVTGAVIYPHRPDLHHKNFWQCEPCDAYVGCHPKAKGKLGGRGDGTVPLGRLANAELRLIKQKAHHAFDPLWKSGPRSPGLMLRHQAYDWLAQQLGIPREECHIGMMDVEQCKAVIAAVAKRDFAEKLAAL